MSNFENLRNMNRQRQLEWGGADKVTTEFKAIEFSEEAGEVMGAVKKLLRAKHGIQGSTLTWLDLVDEIGDVLITLDRLADDFGIDLDKAWVNKFNKTSIKYGLNTRANYAED